MSHGDPISDMLTRLRNALTARNLFVDLPLSQIKLNILKVLEAQGFIEQILVDKEQRKVRVFLKYIKGRTPLIRGIKRISKSSQRHYAKKDKIPVVSGGFGLAVLTTSQGIIDGETARKKGIGGELICYVW